ncbi:hypothetical protein D5086_033093 [Populus alba]|uniref:Uncharacterized protein n=1 Tax=Populus alba TaxID=43335 RepID=A0ACC4AFU9_POPAL
MYKSMFPSIFYNNSNQSLCDDLMQRRHVGSELSIKPKPSLSLLRATLHVAMSAGGSAIEQRGGEIWSLVISRFDFCDEDCLRSEPDLCSSIGQ